jgi:hypothetical protein
MPELTITSPEAESKEKPGVRVPYAGVDYKLTLCPLPSRLQHIYHGQPYARGDFIPQSDTWIWPLSLLIADSKSSF